MATKNFVPKPKGKSFKTAWIHKSTFFKEIPHVRPNVPSNQQNALCEPGTKYPTQIPKPRECRVICGKKSSNFLILLSHDVLFCISFVLLQICVHLRLSAAKNLRIS